MKGLKELLEAKGKSIDPMRKKAKMGVLDELKKLAGGMMGDDVKGLKKVTIAAPDQEGLKEGLDKAEEMVDPSEASEDESMEDEGEEMSLYEIDAKIKELEMLKKMKMKSE